MSITQITCASCGAKGSAARGRCPECLIPFEAAGKTVIQTTDEPVVDVEGGGPTTPFSCSFCEQSYKVDADLVGKVIRCRGCLELNKVDAAPKSELKVGTIERVLRQPTAEKTGPLNPYYKSLILAASGVFLFLLGLAYNASLNERDARQPERDEWSNQSRLRASIRWGTPYEGDKHTPLSDRTPVYLLFGLAGLSMALSVVCWAIEDLFRPKAAVG